MFKDPEQCLFSESSDYMYSFVYSGEGYWWYQQSRVVASLEGLG